MAADHGTGIVKVRIRNCDFDPNKFDLNLIEQALNTLRYNNLFMIQWYITQVSFKNEKQEFNKGYLWHKDSYHSQQQRIFHCRFQV